MRPQPGLYPDGSLKSLSWESQVRLTPALFIRYWLPVLIWLGVIAVLSTDVASQANTSGTLHSVLAALAPIVPLRLEGSFGVDEVIGAMRQTGHLLEYGVLGFLLWRALQGTTRLATSSILAITITVALSVALADEYHQSTTPARTASGLDVLTDAVGAGVAVLIAAWVHRGRGRGKEVD